MLKIINQDIPLFKAVCAIPSLLIFSVLTTTAKLYLLFRLLGVSAITTLVVAFLLTIAAIKTSGLNTNQQKAYREQSSSKMNLLKEMIEGFIDLL